MLGRGGIAIALATLAAALCAPAASASGASGDFDGDGRDDLAVGVPGQNVSGSSAAGAVQVIYGGRNGLSARDRIFTQATPGVRGAPGEPGYFGGSLASGDFDGDGFEDLAIGAPFQAAGVQPAVGRVHVLYGSRNGLSPRGDGLFVPGTPGLGAIAGGERFGRAVAAGDFGRRGRFDDLAIGTPGDPSTDAGSVSVLYGSRQGLSTRRAQRFGQGTANVPETPEAGDGLGWTLATGNLGRNRRSDLAIGVPGESVGTADGAGAVHVLFGRRRGLRARGGVLLTQPDSYSGAPATDPLAEAGDAFGWGLASGDFVGDGRDDLAIGARGEDAADGVPGSPVAGSGILTFMRGTRPGPVPTSQAFYEPVASNEFTTGGNFGTTLAVGNVGYSPKDDVVASATGADSEDPNSGAVSVLYGTEAGISDLHQLSQDGFDVADESEPSDHFGWALAVGRFDGRGPSDLAIGVPGESLPGGMGRGVGGFPPILSAGAVAVFRGTTPGISLEGDRLLFQGEGGLEGAKEDADFFGAALSGPGGAAVFD